MASGTFDEHFIGPVEFQELPRPSVSIRQSGNQMQHPAVGRLAGDLIGAHSGRRREFVGEPVSPGSLRRRPDGKLDMRQFSPLGLDWRVRQRLRRQLRMVSAVSPFGLDRAEIDEAGLSDLERSIVQLLASDRAANEGDAPRPAIRGFAGRPAGRVAGRPVEFAGVAAAPRSFSGRLGWLRSRDREGLRPIRLARPRLVAARRVARQTRSALAARVRRFLRLASSRITERR